MRTFIFYKRITDASGNVKELYITGMTQKDYFPAAETRKGGKFYGCHCSEISAECHIELVKNGK